MGQAALYGAASKPLPYRPLSTVSLCPCASSIQYYFELIRERIERSWEGALARANDSEPLKFDPVFREEYLGIMIEITTGVRWGTDRMETLLDNCRLLGALSMPPLGPTWNPALRGRDYVRATLATMFKDRLPGDRDVTDAIHSQIDNMESARRIAPKSCALISQRAT